MQIEEERDQANLQESVVGVSDHRPAGLRLNKPVQK